MKPIYFSSFYSAMIYHFFAIEAEVIYETIPKSEIKQLATKRYFSILKTRLTNTIIRNENPTVPNADKEIIRTFFSMGKINEHGMLKLPEINASAKPINTVDK